MVAAALSAHAQSFSHEDDGRSHLAVTVDRLARNALRIPPPVTLLRLGCTINYAHSGCVFAGPGKSLRLVSGSPAAVMPNFMRFRAPHLSLALIYSCAKRAIVPG